MFTSSWETHKKAGTPLCWLFQKGDRDSKEFVALTFNGRAYAAYQGHSSRMERCRQLYFLKAPVEQDGNKLPYELHIEVRLIDDSGSAPIELHVNSDDTFDTFRFLHKWVRDEIIRFVDPRHFQVSLDEASDTLRVKPTPEFIKSRRPVETLKIGVVGSIAQASGSDSYIALNLALDEAVDELPARSVMVGVDYDNNRGLANLALQIVNERAAQEAHWYWVHGDELIDREPMVLRAVDWYLKCNALIRIGSSAEAIAAVKRFRKMKVNAHVYEYDFPIFG